MLNFNPTPKPKCKHCGQQKMQHKAATFNCPIGRGSFRHFEHDKVYEPKINEIEDEHSNG